MNRGAWSKEECDRFEVAIHRFGKNWNKVTEHVGTRTKQQVQSHAQKYSKRLEDKKRREDLFNYVVTGKPQRPRKVKYHFEPLPPKSKRKNQNKKNEAMADCLSIDSSQDCLSHTTDSNPINIVTTSDTISVIDKEKVYPAANKVDINDAAFILLTFKYSLLRKHASSRYHQTPAFVYP